jgi:hypothetical protein
MTPRCAHEHNCLDVSLLLTKGIEVKSKHENWTTVRNDDEKMVALVCKNCYELDASTAFFIEAFEIHEQGTHLVSGFQGHSHLSAYFITAGLPHSASK